MKESDFVTYRKFSNLTEVEALATLLEAHSFHFLFEDNSFVQDLTYTGTSRQYEYVIKLAPEDFAKVEALLMKEATALMQEPEASYAHYLDEFTNEELLDVLKKPDEWSKEDYVMARLLLEKKGIHFSDPQLEEMRTSRLNSIRKPKKAPTYLVFLGFFSCAVGVIISIYIWQFYSSWAMIAGFLIGWLLWQSKETDPTGQPFFMYDEPSRKLGRLIFGLNLLSLIVWLFYIFSLF